MKTGKEIHATILSRLREIYENPWMFVSSVRELEVLLHELHWWHSFVTERIPAFVAWHSEKAGEETQHYMSVMLANDDISCAKAVAIIVARWQRYDSDLGIFDEGGVERG